MKEKFLVVAIPFALTASLLFADEKLFQNYPLTEQLISQALSEGSKAKGKSVGLDLQDAAQKWAMMGQGTRGFSVELYTPYSWIAQQSSWGAKKYMEMHREDVTERMLEPVLMVICNPDTPTIIGQVGTSGVEHVIIRSTKKKDFAVIQPIDTELGSELVQNAFGMQIEFESLVGYFSMDELIQISEMDKKGEFFVRIIGTTGEEKDFKIKTKHFKKLP